MCEQQTRAAGVALSARQDTTERPSVTSIVLAAPSRLDGLHPAARVHCKHLTLYISSSHTAPCSVAVVTIVNDLSINVGCSTSRMLPSHACHSHVTACQRDSLLHRRRRQHAKVSATAAVVRALQRAASVVGRPSCNHASLEPQLACSTQTLLQHRSGTQLPCEADLRCSAQMQSNTQVLSSQH